MAHFAKLGANGKVIQVLTLNNSDMLNADGVEDESVGQQYLETHNNWPAQMWIQTSYNTTNNNQHGDGGKAFRNYAGMSYTWDEDNNIFWPKSPHASWTKRYFNCILGCTYLFHQTNGDADPALTAEQDSLQNNTKGWHTFLGLFLE